MGKAFSTPTDAPSMHPMGSPAGQPAAGLYVHVPFCRTKCPYCDFYSITDPVQIPDYVDALLAEFDRYRNVISLADTVYLGGGTPSILTPGQIGSILDGLYSCFQVTADAEVTLEVNPGTVDKRKLASYRAAGINRLNIGLQSVNDRTLRFLGRIHSAKQGLDTYRWARSSGFENVGLDLIYGVPGQTPEQWEAELSASVNLAAQHLSCYTLTVEAGTPLAAKVNNGLLQPLDEKIAGELFTFTASYLNRHGYRQYEVSNFACRPADDDTDWRSRHNRKYWIFAPYLGFGPSAHSFMDNRRWWNHRSLNRYLADIGSGKAPVAGTETLTREQQIMEFIYLGLRQTDGIDTVDFRSRFQADFFDCFTPALEQLFSEGLIETSLNRVGLTAGGMCLLERVADRLIG